ncbi:MAG: hypothetical protein J2P51_15095, partial [Hyphomicrobiaceae bacterium]|nr:hypothetical protein [Hyphomicrobiaceae bacterium]
TPPLPTRPGEPCPGYFNERIRRPMVPRRRGRRGLKGTRIPLGPCREHQQDRRDGGREGLSPGWAQV